MINQIIQKFKNITMHRLMNYSLWALILSATVFSLFNILPFVWWHILATWLLMMVTSYLSNQLLGKIFKVRPNFESQIITANIITLIVGPFDPFSNILNLILIALIAQASKYIFVFRGRHIFNPAAAGVLFGALFLDLGASWWVGSVYLIPVILIIGILMINKLRWWHLPISFLVAYLVLFTAAFQIKPTLTLLAPLLFFSFVMLVEPLTAPAGRKIRIYYGLFVAVLLILLQKFSSISYSLELSLLIGNIFSKILNPTPRLIFKFIRTEEVAANIRSFFFKPLKQFTFNPGQFLEWMLPHEKADNRGIRRWFTIAASPTEKEIMLATKFSEKSSSFKQALLQLKPGDELNTVPPDGDFVLPKDESKKLVFIAGGIGITPFRSMVKYMVDKKLNRDIILLYSCKTEADVAFKQLFEQAKSFGIKPIFVISDQVGYINPDMIKKEVPDWQDRIFYVSGPEPMVESFEKMLASMGIKEANIVRDYFPGYEESA
ncbi:MAG: hypothetical protein A3B10_03420 [Candidatus Doudnabacteria bacterium RIFCSPLOWO2_01_FULL_44_21]|uniref:FAD-binding FR-type domain-containing protein n=1 Tax=Candidatus Doudnabacteria bacterium RIFCSPLOWO2_01_FULL_44_21 TaxID=1817841 RepID=A0A1F5PY24_9BACT|nr:MAG: hypothetical protein A3B95_02430 [Candidatus Doudnabacteria bacterium RIFCSPHIGHO2_02_FULL_43_13b]OGE94816.1 MAG: hypothetical protein A3B10_03420 [Candidatus Doudnabacteria bacterium RIFCSPLOWO2_01_FULL_44_21]